MFIKKNNKWKKEGNKKNKNNKYLDNNKNFSDNREEVKNNFKQTKKDYKITDDNFPTLNVEKKDQPVEKVETESKWKKAIIKQSDKEKNLINVNDPKYWRGHIWIGPICLKQNKYPDCWNNYLKKAQQSHASTIIFPIQKTQYSRDNVNWYNSYEETFTEYQLENMNNQKLEEENKKINEDLDRQLSILFEKRQKESEEYYQITGELDFFAQAEIEREEYEKYAKQFDIEEDEEKENLLDYTNSEEEYENDI